MCDRCCHDGPWESPRGPLSGGYYIVDRQGPTPPDETPTQAVATVTLRLPTNHSATRPIATCLQFGQLCKHVFGESLLCNWGAVAPGCWFRTNCLHWHAPSWREACEAARAYGAEQLQILEDALTARALELADMECPENRPHAAKPGRARPIHLPKHEKETENANV